ncbi:MAG TPA: hypothetical protein DEG71_02825 [Clostridiales bacterium]|nr:hypothetical protein [Clostridiales bacterium]
MKKGGWGGYSKTSNFCMAVREYESEEEMGKNLKEVLRAAGHTNVDIFLSREPQVKKTYIARSIPSGDCGKTYLDFYDHDRKKAYNARLNSGDWKYILKMYSFRIQEFDDDENSRRVIIKCDDGNMRLINDSSLGDLKIAKGIQEFELN